MKTRRLLQTLPIALFAILFGGVGFGTGNMLQLVLDPEGAAEAHEHGAREAAGHGDFAMVCGDGAGAVVAAPPSEADAPLPLPPEHCLFCLDGIAPQPVPQGDSTPPDHPRPALPRPRPVAAAPLSPRTNADPARGPPVLF
ncbi:MAG: hypothetical protein V2J24_06415 [Pseudomonadales bacterium]|nr:hypothetical protein [Pseudomonadales bacterium]